MTRLLLTAGPTREPIDPVRFLSNASSGRQAVAIAEEALSRGWVVDVVHGPLEVPLPGGAVCHPVLTAGEMLESCLRLHPDCDVLIGAAAVSDYRPLETRPSKRKRTPGPWTLELVPTKDVLAELGPAKGERVHVGFALESERLLENAIEKLRAKRLDLIVANPVEAIGARGSTYCLLGADGTARELGSLRKDELARALLDAIESLPRYRTRLETG